MHLWAETNRRGLSRGPGGHTENMSRFLTDIRESVIDCICKWPYTIKRPNTIRSGALVVSDLAYEITI